MQSHPLNQQIDVMAEAERFTAMKRKGHTGEYCGPCPVCGGKDRFVVRGDKWLCRHCTDGKWRDGIAFIMFTRNTDFKGACSIVEGNKPLTPQERERIAAERAERAERELRESIERAQKALKELREAHAWTRYHEQLENDESARDIWRKRGVPDVYQDIFSFGYDRSHVYYFNDTQHYSPSLTIPIFDIGGECVNVRHRLLAPKDSGDKYRQERANLPISPWFSDPSLDNPQSVLVVEGEIKAAVSYITADDPTMQAIGMPGKSHDASSAQAYLDNVDCPIYICPDPDTHENAVRDSEIVGKERARLILLPGKIDDMINRYGLGKEWMQTIFRQARRVS